MKAVEETKKTMKISDCTVDQGKVYGLDNQGVVVEVAEMLAYIFGSDEFEITATQSKKTDLLDD